MRIGFDMLAVQSPHHGQRGIGRYSRHLVRALLDRDEGHEYVLYAHAALPAEGIPSAPNARLCWLEDDALTVSQRVDRRARANPDGLDALVVLSPFEHWSNYHPPARREGGPRLLAVVYDMIPFLFAREGAYDPVLMRHYRVLEDLKRYDALLAISEATRRDCLRLLGLAPDRVTTIGGASDEQFFVPDRSASPSAASRSILKGLGINRPFVLNVGGFDVRKNLWTLIDAFALLPAPLRRKLQLVLTFTVLDSDRDRLFRYARAAGLGDALVVTGEVSDAALRVLYQRCEAFAFPSLYEGFGLPLLEAMQCGAVVVAGNNSAQVEVVGEAGLLANASDACDIAAKLARVLEDEPLARSLRARADTHAGQFSWSATAARAAAVLQDLPPMRRDSEVSQHDKVVGRARSSPRRVRRPRIAFFSPFPPQKSGIADYAAALIDALKPTYTIDLYHESGFVPEPALADQGVMCCDARLFPRQAAVRDYHALVYQMGNSRYHRFMYETMLRYPGVVTLHDFCLAGFHLEYGYRQGREWEALREEVLRWHPDQAGAVAEILGAADADPESIGRACAERGWSLNRTILPSAARSCGAFALVPGAGAGGGAGGCRAGRGDSTREPRAQPARRPRARGDPGAVRLTRRGADRRLLRLHQFRQDVCRGHPRFPVGGYVRSIGPVRVRGPGSRRRRSPGGSAGAGPDRAGPVPRPPARRRLRRPDRRYRRGREPPPASYQWRDLGGTPRPPGRRRGHDRHRRGDVRRLPRHRGPQGALGSCAGARGAAPRLTDARRRLQRAPGARPGGLEPRARASRLVAAGAATWTRASTCHARDANRAAELPYRSPWRPRRSSTSPLTKGGIRAGCSPGDDLSAGQTPQPQTVRRRRGVRGPTLRDRGAPRRRVRRPRIAFFSPLPPQKSGVSDYSALLLEELKETYEIDLYHETGAIPQLALAEDGFACCDARLFSRRAAVRDYHAVVYQMGNSPYHQFLYKTMQRHPGVVTLHDFCLAGFHLMYGQRQGRERELLREELLRWYPGDARAIAEVLETTPWDREVIARACAERGWFLNRGVLGCAQRVVVHSPWCLEQARRAAPEDAARMTVIPFGIWPRSLSAEQRAAIRARFEIPADALLVASFGFIHPDKMSPEALDVFREVARSDPSAMFVFAGEEADGGVVRRHAAALGLAERVRFLGHQTMSDFNDLIAATDVGVNLRRPPTNGETSAALLQLLASGVATIVTDVATFSDYPSSTVWKVRCEPEGAPGLERALRTLAADPAARAALGRAAQSYTRENHEWSRVAKMYVDVIESCRETPRETRPARPEFQVKS